MAPVVPSCRTYDAIIGTGKNAIIGTGKAKVVLRQVPVDKFDATTRTVEVLGRALSLTESNAVTKALLNGDEIGIVALGKMRLDGRLSNVSLRIAPLGYVPGVSTVAVAGRVSSTKTNVGRFNVGKIEVDCAALQLTRSPRDGELVLVTGTQPQRGGAILATGVSYR